MRATMPSISATGDSRCGQMSWTDTGPDASSTFAIVTPFATQVESPPWHVGTRGSCADTNGIPLPPSISETMYRRSALFQSHVLMLNVVWEWYICYGKSSGTPATVAPAPSDRLEVT